MPKVNNIRPGVDIAFADKTRTIYPVTLRQLRKLTNVMKEMENVQDDDDRSVDLMVQAASIILEKIDPEIYEDFDLLEDLLDIKSFNAMVAAAMGTDPNE